ncbi:MAG: hypothetical protein CMJ54_12310 [Planctomycetaceae bacterium]|nr:hypothetical protein [Planctomycetaceae bacterium]
MVPATSRRSRSYAASSEPRVKTFAQTLDLVDDPDRIAEYERHHASVWPEVLRGLRSIGIRSMRIWRTGPRLFMVFEADDDFDPARDYQAYTDDPRCRAWDDLMRPYQRRIPTADPDDGGWWTTMDLVFDQNAAAETTTEMRTDD